ncbi:GNAT family N-acetyltransferase [Brevibacillus dissolubilis]|uniref:GNAT family N-acetyltransferase n=1 Tax=Brevibacillus dissolubilis TaxID=1844116 RepID=UPI0011160C40|nr:GNAT family N-acyltransferase [Brevibacillus dissolubilis]
MSQSSPAWNMQNPELTVSLAKTSEEIEQALRLRYQVFVVEEQNPNLINDHGIETDEYDVYCDHLIIKDQATSQVIGTYRLLPGERAILHNGFYSETEFDLTGFEACKKQALELGRSCIAEEYRGGKAIQLLWEGIAQYISEHGQSYLIGCASIPTPTLAELNELYSMLCRKDAITETYGIRPLPKNRIDGLQAIELAGEEKELFRRLPPLMKGYYWLGAQIAGEPAYDPVFRTTDFFILLDREHISKKYKKHFLKKY